MAARIPLILSQPARRDAEAIDLIENIVAAAMLSPGLDANLIGDISTVELGGTDHLCLLGHTRDIVLASFLDLAEAQVAWQRLGQVGHFVDCASSEETIRSSQRAADGMRRVFYFRLRLGQPVPALFDLCHKLLAAQQLNLVTIRLGTVSPAQAPPMQLPVVSRVQPPPAPKPRAGETAMGQAAAATPLLHAADVGQDRLFDDDDPRWNELDKLVDDLDAMDL